MKSDSRSTRRVAERNQLELFRAMPGDMAPRDAQDLMAYPFFALGKNRRTIPIHFEARQVVICVEGTAEHGIATIWDADVLIWAASQIVEARDAQLPTSRLIAATPYEILRFTGRGTSLRDYQRLRSALDRLQSTTVATSIRQPSVRRLHRFSWLNEWTERTTRDGKSLGLELILPDWFYTGVLDSALVLTIDHAYFRLSGGIEKPCGFPNRTIPVDNTHTTRIEVRLIPNRLNIWVCFGRVAHENYIGLIWRALYFAPGSIFGVVQRIESPHGTVLQQLSVLQIPNAEAVAREPDLSPKNRTLLRVAGGRKCNLVLALIDAIQDQDIDPADVYPDYWHALHRRLSTNHDPHLYTRAEHQLYLDQIVHKR